MSTGTKRILAFAGSTRKDSLNRKLLQIAIHSAAESGGVITLLNLEDYPLPLYNGDLEAESGIPLKALQLKNLFKEHEGLLIASPEYNSSITPLLKNTIDWISRPLPGEPELICFDGKVAGLISASPGALGGIRSLFALRSLLSNIKVFVVPDMVAVPKADKVLDEKGNLSDPKLQKAIDSLGVKLVQTVTKLAPEKLL